MPSAVTIVSGHARWRIAAALGMSSNVPSRITVGAGRVDALHVLVWPRREGMGSGACPARVRRSLGRRSAARRVADLGRPALRRRSDGRARCRRDRGWPGRRRRVGRAIAGRTARPRVQGRHDPPRAGRPARPRSRLRPGRFGSDERSRPRGAPRGAPGPSPPTGSARRCSRTVRHSAGRVPGPGARRVDRARGPGRGRGACRRCGCSCDGEQG